MRLLSALVLTLATAFASCNLSDGEPTPPPGADGGGMNPHDPSGDGGATSFDANHFPDASFMPDSGTIVPTMDAL